jgi:hypothetical protein
MIKEGWIEAHKVEGIDAGGRQKKKLDRNAYRSARLHSIYRLL